MSHIELLYCFFYYLGYYLGCYQIKKDYKKKSTVNINGTIGDPFPVKVGVHQGSVQSPLLLIIVLVIIVLEALSREFRTGLPWELLYADDLVLMADSIEELEILFERWKSGMEQKGIRVNSEKTKVVISKHKRNPQNKTGNFACSVCLKGVGRNYILCPACKCWVHAKCSLFKRPTCQSNQLCMLTM